MIVLGNTSEAGDILLNCKIGLVGNNSKQLSSDIIEIVNQAKKMNNGISEYFNFDPAIKKYSKTELLEEMNNYIEANQKK